MDLKAKRVVVTRPRHQSAELMDLLEKEGSEVVEFPTIQIVDPESWSALDDALGRLSSFDWLAFNSANAAERFFTRADETKVDLTKTRLKVAAVGRATKERIEQGGLRVDLVPESSNALALADELGAGDGRGVLVPRAAEVPPAMGNALRAAGWRVTEAPAYRTVPADVDASLRARVRDGEFDVVTFTSGSSATAFVSLVEIPEGVAAMTAASSRKVCACIGSVTATAAREAGLRVDVVAKEQTAAGLVAALVAHPAWDD